MITLLVWASYGWIALLAAKSLDLNLAAVPTVIATYLSYLLGMVPLLPVGLGTAEVGLSGLLTLFGSSFSKAVAMTLLLRFAVYCSLCL